MIIAPVFSTVGDTTSSIVGIAGGIIAWDRYLLNLLPDGVTGIHCVLESECGNGPTRYTYELRGTKVRTETRVFVALDDTSQHPSPASLHHFRRRF